jgi:hypothetical protein
MASVAILVTHGLCSRVFLMAWYHYSVEFFEDLRNINHCEFLVMKHSPNGRYVLQNQLRRWSDLKRERAAARKNSLSAPPEAIPTIPVRRWTQSKSAHDPTGASFIPRPARKNTADMFRDDPEPIEEGGEQRSNPSMSPLQKRADRAASISRDRSRTRVRSSSNLRSSLSNLALDSGRKGSTIMGVKSYLGRDGGGTRSGQGSPFGSDDEELDNESPLGTSQPPFPPLSGSPVGFRKTLSGSLGRALRGELDDPNRKMADALGDQSDAEVDEADLEMGTKARITDEMEQILEEERRDRIQGGATGY